MSQQPCYHRIKRILNSYQQSADRSLKGPDGDDRTTAVVATAPDASKSLRPDAARPGFFIEMPSEEAEKCIQTDSALSTERRIGVSAPRSDTKPASVSKAISKPSNAPGPICPLLIAAEGSTSYELTEAMLKNKPISCFKIGGERRLCLPQVLKDVLNIFTPAQIQAVSDALHINFAECNAAQLEALKKGGVLPSGVPRCGLITLTDAERLCAALLESPPSTCQSRLDSTAIPVAHECFGGCKGMFLPREYLSPCSLCIECLKCTGRLNPSEFVTHTHSRQEDRICHWGFDMSNWRFYVMLSPNSEDMSVVHKQQKMLDDMKSRFLDKEVSRMTVDSAVSSSWTTHCNKKVKLDNSHRVCVKPPPSPEDVSEKWKPVNPYTTWAACLNMVQRLKHVQHNASNNTSLPAYLCTGVPVLDDPDRVVPLDDAERYDRNFAPNVSLSIEPFDELRRLRQEAQFNEEMAEAVDATPVSIDARGASVPLASRRWTQSSCDMRSSEHDDDDNEDDGDGYDTESVSSDKLEAEQEAVVEEEVDHGKMLMVDLDSQLAFVRSAVCDNDEMKQSVAQSMVKHLSMFQGRQLQLVQALNDKNCSVQQALRDVWSSIEAQRLAEKQRYEDELLRQRQEGAAKMREAVLERHRLLQQIETFSDTNTSSDQAAMAERYKNEAEYWKSRLEDAEAVNARLQLELVELRKALIAQQHQQTIWTSSKGDLTVEGVPLIKLVATADDENGRRDVAVSPLQSS